MALILDSVCETKKLEKFHSHEIGWIRTIFLSILIRINIVMDVISYVYIYAKHDIGNKFVE